MSIEFDRFTEELKEKSDLVEVIEATSEYRFDTRKVGRYVKCKHPDSLMVDADWGVYTWFAKSGEGGHTFESGDVFHWLERYNNMSFWEAALWLANRYGVRVPDKAKNVDPEVQKKNKSRQEVLDISCKWFEEQLWANPGVIDYCTRRGWSEKTMRAAHLGFSPGYKGIQGLMDTLMMHEVNFDDPATVSVVGKQGDVAAWINKNKIEGENPDWITKGKIHGLAAMPRLIYPHLWRGRVAYFSARNLTEENGKWVGGDKPKSYNLHRSLAGERSYFFNSEFTRGADICLVLEGQADAISAAQLGFSAVALAGVSASERLGELFRAHKIKRVFVGLDSDKAGKDNALKTAEIFGPLTRLIDWGDLSEVRGGSEILDGLDEEVMTTEPVGEWVPVGE